MNINESTVLEIPKLDLERIKPGQIWEVSRRLYCPLEFSQQERQRLYSDAARRFLNGDGLLHYVAIITEPEWAISAEEPWRVVSVMVLSLQTEYLSDVDILIPSQLSGVGRDLLAQTWQVVPMLTCNLSCQVGRGLSRSIYDRLLDIGDYYCGLIDKSPTLEEIESLGLQVGASHSSQRQEIQAFHQQEMDWATILEVPVAAYRAHLKTLAVTDSLLEQALEIEREFLNVEQTPICLSQWFDGIVQTGWQTFEQLLELYPAHPAFSFRKGVEVGEVSADNSLEVARSIELLSATEDVDELWNAAEALRVIDPDRPELGIRKAKLINLADKSDESIVALSMAQIRKPAGETYILVRVYPTAEAHLQPEVKLSLLDRWGETVLQAIARRTDTSIQLCLSGQPGETFAIALAFKDSIVIERFVI